MDPPPIRGSAIGALQGLNRKFIGFLWAFVWLVFIEHILNRVFQNRDSIILLHEALVKSNFDGFKSPNPFIFMNFRIIGHVTDP